MNDGLTMKAKVAQLPILASPSRLARCIIQRSRWRARLPWSFSSQPTMGQPMR